MVVLAFSNSSYANDGGMGFDEAATFDTTAEYLHEQKFFESPASLVMPEVQDSGIDYADYAFERTAGGSGEYKDIDPDKMPLFKTLRLSIQNKISNKVAERERRIESGEDKGLFAKLILE